MLIKERIKGFTAGIIIATLVFSAVFASSVEMYIKVAYNNIKIYVDGKLIHPMNEVGNPVEPMIYDGTTYLPVRAVGQAIGKEVNWDGWTDSVYIGKYDGARKESVKLQDMDYFNYQKSSESIYWDNWNSLGDMDNTGNRYSQGHVFYFGDNGSQYAEYLIKQKYKYIKGTFVLQHEYRTRNRQASLKIYGDEKLLYTSGLIYAGVEPIAFDVDITGVRKLKIEIESQNGSILENSEFGIVDTVLYQ